MKKTIGLLFLAVFLVSCSKEILNLTFAKKEVADYYESGKYDSEVDEIAKSTIAKLEKMEFRPGDAAVFDIDETLLSNYPVIKSTNFGSVSKAWDEWFSAPKAKAIPQIKKVYDYLVAKGIKIFFITGRNGKYYEPTKQNLINEGFTKIDTLICRSEKERNIKAVEYKSTHRANLVKAGARIIINVGDQQSDLDGGNSGLMIKLPNYLYFTE